MFHENFIFKSKQVTPSHSLSTPDVDSTSSILFYNSNLYAGQEATVRTGHGTTDWFQIGQGLRQG